MVDLLQCEWEGWDLVWVKPPFQSLNQLFLKGMYDPLLPLRNFELAQFIGSTFTKFGRIKGAIKFLGIQAPFLLLLSLSLLSL